jgi:hypothetical protein
MFEQSSINNKNMHMWGITVGIEALTNVEGHILEMVQFQLLHWPSPYDFADQKLQTAQASLMLEMMVSKLAQGATTTNSYQTSFSTQLTNLLDTRNNLSSALSNQKTSNPPLLLCSYHCNLQLQNEMQII